MYLYVKEVNELFFTFAKFPVSYDFSYFLPHRAHL